jgi:uncharacterized protein (DUF2336 family)
MNAQLSFINDIEGTIARSSAARRAEMARRLADLYLVNVDQYSDDEVSLIDEVFVRLVVTIEESARALLAIRLGPNSKAPPNILKALACDDAIDVASPVLIYADRLDDTTLIECAKTKSQEHMLSISRRKTIPEALTDILVERGDPQILLSTVQNAGAKFSNSGFATLIDRSHGDDLLATNVGRRPDLPLQLFEQLIEVASDTVRSKLAAESPGVRHNVHRVVNDVAAQIKTRAASQPPIYAAAQVLVESLQKSGHLDAEKLEAFAEADRYEEVIAALAVMAKMTTDAVERKANDDKSEFLLILAKAIGLSWTTTKSILTLVGRHNRYLAGDAEQDQKAFQRLHQQTALQILSFHRKRENSTAKQLM